jgi:hypothetical protein
VVQKFAMRTSDHARAAPLKTLSVQSSFAIHANVTPSLPDQGSFARPLPAAIATEATLYA